MRLKSNEVCPYTETCPFAEKHDKINYCRGTVTRDCEFICRYTDEDRKVTSEEFLSRKVKRVSKNHP